MADLIAGNPSTIYSLAINSSASSSIDYFGDTDWWRVSLTGGYGYQVWVEGWSSGGGTLSDPYLAVYNSAGVLQLYSNDISLFNYDSYLSVVPSGSGTFYLSTEEYGHNATGTYTITLWQDQLASTASVATIAVNSLVTDRIGWQGDTSDWGRVTLTAGTLYQFDLVGTSGDGSALSLADPYLALRNSAGTLIAYDDDSGVGLNSRIFYTPTTSGTYFLDVQVANNGYGTYSLIVNAAPTASTITVGSSVAGSINFAGDTNLHSVSLTAGVTYGFALDGTTLVDPFMELLDRNGVVVDFDDDSGPGLHSSITYTPSVTGTYYLAARESGNNATGTYTLNASAWPTIRISDTTVTETDSGQVNATFTVTLSQAVQRDVTVAYSTSNLSAIAGSDYGARSAQLVIAAGSTSATITVPVYGDNLFEATEFFSVNLSNPINATIADSVGFGYILDDDRPASVTFPTDNYFPYQWYLFSEYGINILPAWQDYTGRGVQVGVFDWGIDGFHPDLDGNFMSSLSKDAATLTGNGLPRLTGDNHGTAVAGVIGAERNGSGIVGVAYNTDLVSIYTTGAVAAISNAFAYARSLDVLNNSWGFAPENPVIAALTDWAFYDNFSTPTFSAAGNELQNLATLGRNGLGTVVVQSAGNSYDVGDDTNLHNFQNSRYIITVAATDYFGQATSYSSPGASILVAAPGGARESYPIVTTDRVGAAGYDSTDYYFITGTSFSAPIVSGIVALMLEANPNLGYRDVQEILAYSARRIGADWSNWEFNGAQNWNGGGLHFDGGLHQYGFGLVDATAAVRLAETWGSAHTVANLQELSFSRAPNLAIPDNNVLGISDTVVVSQHMEIERIDATLNITHTFIGDLTIALVSPSGIWSWLMYRPAQGDLPLSAYGSSQNNVNFTFNTVASWGEDSAGGWTLRVFDNSGGDFGTLNSWSLNFIGKPASADDTYVYTNEFSESRANQPARAALSDTGGIDTLNAAAVSADLILNLTPGGVSTIDGQSLTISVGTVIENAYGGDGNDNITGNGSANVLYGMRGNDTLNGGAGNDILNGGAGIDTAVYSGNFAAYTIGGAALNYFTFSGPDGTDTLSNIERLQFADKELAFYQALSIVGQVPVLPDYHFFS